MTTTISIPIETPATSDLLAKAKATIARELERLQIKSQSQGLESREHMSLKTLLSSLREVAEAEKELADNSGVDAISDDELRNQVRGVL